MTGSIKVSIIIPVYNCGKYLNQCLNSIICQSLQELEIICIDDGSTDDSVEILKTHRKTDPRIIIEQQKNQGAGAARNTALEKAKGQYVAFLDADDYYKNENALEIMYEACEKSGALICASAKRCLLSDVEEVVDLFQEKCIGKKLKYEDYQMQFYYQNYLIQREILEENSIFFPLYRRYQDPPFFVKALFSAGEFIVADTCLYCYRISDIRVKFDTRKVEDMLNGFFDNLLFAMNNNLDLLFHETVEQYNDEGYNTIIHENISSESLEILELLLKANQIIRKKYNDPKYIIKPLRLLLFNFKTYEKKLLQTIEKQNEITLYGAGKNAQIFLHFLQKKEMLYKVKNIVVTKSADNPCSIFTIPVVSFSEFLSMGKETFFIITANEDNSHEIQKILEQNNCKEYVILDNYFWKQL